MSASLSEGYQKLVNAIIKQAVVDYRKSRKYLREHPKTDELVEIVTRQVERRKKRQEGRIARGQLPITEKRSQEEELLNRIQKAERLMNDAVRFFQSDWFFHLCEADGNRLLIKLEEEFK